MITVSVVCHGHGALVKNLVDALLTCPEVGQIILTWNIPEKHKKIKTGRIINITNQQPKGFGANHNAAFVLCNQPFFCPLNPDIELLGNPFPALVQSLSASSAALVAPLVLAPNGGIEDSIRYFPTLHSLLIKILGGANGSYPVHRGQPDFCAEWVAGMFMLFRSEVFLQLRGFDEAYFLYYEDVDICVRAWQQGLKVVACPSVSVIHDARRESRRSLRHGCWHLMSLVRYLRKHWGRLPDIVDSQVGK